MVLTTKWVLVSLFETTKAMIKIIAACYHCQELVSSPVLVELKALWRVLKLCTELGIDNIIYKEDALKIIEDIKDVEENWSPFGQVIEDIKVLFRSRSKWHLYFCPREGNVVAHKLVKFALLYK